MRAYISSLSTMKPRSAASAAIPASSLSGIEQPVGLPGEVRQTSFVLGVSARSMSPARSAKSFSSFVSTSTAAPPASATQDL